MGTRPEEYARAKIKIAHETTLFATGVINSTFSKVYYGHVTQIAFTSRPYCGKTEL